MKGMLLGDCKPIVILRKYEDKIKKVAATNFDKQPSHYEKKGKFVKYLEAY